MLTMCPADLRCIGGSLGKANQRFKEVEQIRKNNVAYKFLESQAGGSIGGVVGGQEEMDVVTCFGTYLSDHAIDQSSNDVAGAFFLFIDFGGGNRTERVQDLISLLRCTPTEFPEYPDQRGFNSPLILKETRFGHIWP